MRNQRTSVLIITLFASALVLRGQQPRVSLAVTPLWPASGDTASLPVDQYVFFDPSKNQWVVSYPEDLKKPQTSPRITLRFDIHSQVDPVLSTQVSRNADNSYSYAYVLQNSKSAATAVKKWTVLVPSPDQKFKGQHPKWTFFRKEDATVRDALPAASRLVVLEWEAGDVVVPGGVSAPFTASSDCSPGFTTASFSGLVKAEYTDQIAKTLPKAIADQVAKVFSPASDQLVRMVLAPRFPAGTPQIIVADNFHFGIRLFVQQGELSAHSVFVKEALTALQSFLTSGGASVLTAADLGFLSKAKPGVESEIASELKLSILR